MELKDFIFETISAICDATIELQEKLSPMGHSINPPTPDGTDKSASFGVESTLRRVEYVDFDVMVTAGSETSGGGKAGISVLSVELGAKGQHDVKSETVNKLRFSIPISMRPAQDLERNLEDERVRRERNESAMKTASSRRRGGSSWMGS